MKKIIFIMFVFLLVKVYPAYCLNVEVYNSSNTPVGISIDRNKDWGSNWDQNLFNMFASDVTKGLYKASDTWWSETVDKKSSNGANGFSEKDDLGGNYKTIKGIVLSLVDFGGVSIAIPPVPEAWDGKSDVQRIQVHVSPLYEVSVEYYADIHVLANPSGNFAGKESYQMKRLMEASSFRMKHDNKKQKMFHTCLDRQHIDEIMTYLNWNNEFYEAIIAGEGFEIRPRGDKQPRKFVRFLKYIAPNGGKYTARLRDKMFLHAPEGDLEKEFEDYLINYKVKDGSSWFAEVVVDNNRYKFKHYSSEFRLVGDRIDYISSNGDNYSAIIVDNMFIHSPQNNPSYQFMSDRIDYKTTQGDGYSAKIDGNEFVHFPVGKPGNSHRDFILYYKTWSGENWRLALK